jgi:VWFA-related protein
MARAQDDVTFSTDVKVVNVLATVRDKQGKIIRDLAQSDFSVLENGRLQTIRYFSRESDLPLTLGLLVDTSMSQQRVLDAERSASFRFLDQVLRENKDHVFLLQFDMAIMMRQALTSSHKDLSAALGLVDTPTREELQHQYGGGTLLYDAIIKASKDVMKAQSGRKALIVLSDGVDTGSDASLADAVEAAQLADTLIYSILFSDATFYRVPLAGLSGPNGRAVLQRLSRETGGSFFEVSKKQSIEQIFEELQEELRTQYSLGYVSDVPVQISEFRKIQVAVDKKELTVQARSRYWARR